MTNQLSLLSLLNEMSRADLGERCSSSGLTVACQLLSFLSLPSGTLCSVAG